MITSIMLSLCLHVAEQAAQVMVQRQLGVTREVLELFAPAPVVDEAFKFDMLDLGLDQERLIDDFHLSWFMRCLAEKEKDKENY